MGKSVWVSPLYIPVAWVMLVSYQLFTQEALNSVIPMIGALQPAIGIWMNTHLDAMVFVHTFAWVWVLSSLIPSILLGKERSVLITFLFCLTLAFAAISAGEIFYLLSLIPFIPRWGNSTEQIFNVSFWLGKPVLAFLYLSAPYLIMLSVDLYGRRKSNILSRNLQMTIT